MAPNILPLKEINLQSRNYTIHAIVVERGIPRTSAKGTSQYQRLVLQDSEVIHLVIKSYIAHSITYRKIKILTQIIIVQGTRIQATIYGNDIRILENRLQLFQTYSITNATVTATQENFRFLEQKNQLTISARNPVREMTIDGLTLRSIKYNFTPIIALTEVTDPDPNLGRSLLHLSSSIQIHKFILTLHLIFPRCVICYPGSWDSKTSK